MRTTDNPALNFGQNPRRSTRKQSVSVVPIAEQAVCRHNNNPRRRLGSRLAHLTEFSIRLMLSPHLKEVHVSEAAKNLTIAVMMTIFDAATVVWCGGVIWQALSPIIWSRILILLLSALWALSLARIWVRAIYSLRHRSRNPRGNLATGTVFPSIDVRGEGDV